MDESENPYEILGVNRTATATEIKAAYRKLALLHHPDRKSTEEDKQRAHVVFAKISNAYEILSDVKTRNKLDREQQQQQQPYYGGTTKSGPQAAYEPQPDFGNYYETPLHGSSSFGHENGVGSDHDFFHNHIHRSRHPFAFHDPFEIFSQVFGEEFGTRRRSSNNNSNNPSTFPHDNGAGGFMDPFQAHRSMMFNNNPFFGGGGGGMFGGPDLFSSMDRQMGMMNQMMQQQHQQQQQQQGSRGAPAGGPQVFYSSSSSSFGGGSGGPRGHVSSVSTSTRIVNGKRQTVTERITTKPDGTIERHVETSGDEDFPQLQQRQSQQQALPPPPSSQLAKQRQQQQQQQQPQRRSSRSQQPQIEHKPQHPRPQVDIDDDDNDDDDDDDYRHNQDQSNKRSRFSWRRKS